MEEKKARAAPQLQFSEEERSEEALKKPLPQADKAADRRDRMKARLRREQRARKAPAPEKPPSSRLRFEENTPSPPRLAQKMMKQAVSAELHRRMAQDEEENTGFQAVHTAELAGEKLLNAGKQARQSKLRHDHHRLAKAEKKLDRANNRFLQREQEVRQPERVGSNPLSRMYQRRAIRKKYLAARAGRSAGSAYAAGKAVKPVRKAAALPRKKHGLLVFGLVFLLAFIMNGLSSCTPLLEAGLHAFVMGTYPAEEADVKAAELAYKAMEDKLKRELEGYERHHPSYDEYAIEADTSAIQHDPYALMAILSAYHGGEEWTMDDVYGTMEMLFDWQYKVTENISTETRYRTERRQGTRLVTDPATGETYLETYAYDAQVPYAYTICTVTLKAEILSHAPVYIMSRQKMGLYALYMSTLGNMPHLFGGQIKEPVKYDVPQELLDADPQFALLVEEANKRLGYPYVWSGYEPETSFDCSGFISWVFTSTGVNNIGHMGATSLYGYGTPVRPEDAKPGDVIFFQGTMGDGVEGITHCGLYVGNHRMIHCGSPCTYADLNDSYWQQHFYGFSRLYDH